MPPRAISFLPIERCFPTLLVYRHPTKQQPEFRSLISIGCDEVLIFAASNRARAEGKTRNDGAMPRCFIVVGKIATVMADGCNRFLEVDKCHRGKRFSLCLCAFST